MVTLKDVAKEAGLTVSTVSRIMNNRGYISADARSNVEKAIKKLNYQPNELARSLSKKTTNTIGVIVPHISHPFFAELISNIEYIASRKNLKVLLFNSREKEEREKIYLDMCTSNRVAGIILCSGNVGVNEFESFNIPLITIERNLDNGTASVECDNFQGGRLAAQHLIDCGCKELLNFSGVHNAEMPADMRWKGFREVCEKYKIKHVEVETQPYQYSTLEYAETIEQVIRNHPNVDGIFASSDLIAAQIIQVCTKLGKKIPDDLQLVGFDDVLIATVTTPEITTIHQPIKEMAEAAVELLVSASKNKIVATRTLLPVSLVKRGTTKEQTRL